MSFLHVGGGFLASIQIIRSTLTRLAITLASLASATIPAGAALVQTRVSSATELAYSADVSTTDLLAGKTATSVSGWNLTNGSTVAALNNGIHGVSGLPVTGSWTTVGATATYNLGLGANNLGYDITSIQSIAAWLSAGFGNQGYTVDVKLVGAASYTTLATVDYQPLGSAVGATKVTLTDTTGVLETGVEFIRFTAKSVNGGANSGAFVFREIDVFGRSSTTSNIGRLTLKSTGSLPTPSIIGYNHGFFTKGGNARAWWEYSGVNAVRIFISPAKTEPADDIAPRGDGVSSDATFESRKTALRADPLNPTFINWTYFNDNFDVWNFPLSQYRDMGLQTMVICSADESLIPINSSSDYAGRWELWQHFYASAFHYARNFDITRYQIFNEPDHPNAGGITQAEWLLRLQLASDAIQCAISDVNSRYGKSLKPNIHAPVISNPTYSPWGNLAVDNRHRNYRGVVSNSFWNMHSFAYHHYNSTASGAFHTSTGMQSSIAADMTGETPFPLSLTEFNVHNAFTFDSMPDTLDYPAKYARFGAIVCELAKSGLDEMYCFKFSQTEDTEATYGVKKNGMHYVDNNNAPNSHGGVTKAGEAYRLFNKGIAPGRVMKDYTRASDGSIDALDLRTSYDAVSKKYFIYSVNESSNSVPITVDTSAWNIPTNNRVLLEEVSESRHGSGRILGSVTADKTLFDGSVNLWQQPANTVWLWTIPSKAQEEEETVTVAEDTMVKDGSNAGINYGSATSLVVRNDPSNSANRSAAFLKFNLPPIYLPDIQIATLCVRTRANPSGTAQGYLYGVDNNTWSESTMTWTNAPNLKKGRSAGNKIVNRVIDGEGTTARILGQLVAASTTPSERIIDVTEYLRSQPNRVPSFLITQDPRWDVSLPSLAAGDTQPGGLEITSSEGSSKPYLRIVRLKDTDDDGISDEAETNTFTTNPNAADSDSDGISDGVEILVNNTNPKLNNAPTISNITDRSIALNTNTGAIAVTVGDLETAAASLTLTGASSNPALIPLSGIVFGGSGANRTVTVTPAANQTGTSTITVTVRDGAVTASDTFLVTVTNTTPTISDITDRSIALNTNTGVIPVTVGDLETAAASLTLTGASSNPALIPLSGIVFGGSGANRTVSVTPAASQTGSSTITVSVSDGLLTTSDTFLVTVFDPAPTISDITDRGIALNANTGDIAVTIGDLDTAAASLTLTGASSNPALIPLSGIVFGGSGENRTVSVTPAANQLGSSTITVTVSDGVFTASDTFLVTVTGNAIESWRFANFGTAANSGNGADSFDANNDGEINLLEYATEQNPNASSLAVLAANRTASELELTYTRSKAAFTDGVVFTVEWSDTLDPNSWSNALVTQNILTDNGTIQTVKATIPAGSAIRMRYARLKVTQTP